ncbi:MAG: glutamate 5-kinase [Clostridiales bacterium]|nr:glutamate 5-kinase [Clostridiales bacterium]
MSDMSKKRIVVKVGTSTICHGGKGLHFRSIDNLARTLTDIKNAGHEVILVSSGAIGAGCGKLNLPKRPSEIRMKQAVAAVGQCELMHIYDKIFGEYGATVGQILLTRDDIDHPGVKQNLLGTFETLIEMGVIPVVNENDSVCIEEIESEHKVFGDNDTLSAAVAVLVSADILVILSDIDGLYTGDPRTDKNAVLIPVVENLGDDATCAFTAGGAGTDFGTGGMSTKITAARIATKNGIDTVIMSGAHPERLYGVLDGEIYGTLFKKCERSERT